MFEVNAQRAAWWLQVSVAFVWLATGLLVLHPTYRSIGTSYLDLGGFPHWMMYAACLLEIILAVTLICTKPSTILTVFQVVLVTAFTLILAVIEPPLMVHYFGVLTKNIPLVAVVLAAWMMQKDGWSKKAEWCLRIGLASIWMTEGLFPKIFFQQAAELKVVVDSGLVPIDAGWFLVGMGIAQGISGIFVLALKGRALSIVLLIQFFSLIILPYLVTMNDLTPWVHPFGPLTKNVPILMGSLVLLLFTSPWVEKS